jgi:hypothetical protein
MGRFLLLGSISPALMTQVSESLAGRLTLVELTPFLQTELRKGFHRESLWLCGGFPDGGVLERERFPRWQRDYLSLLTQRDLPSWGLPARPQTTDRLLRMLTAVHGQIWNASQIGQSLGLSYHTVNSYVDYLEGAFLIRRLPPYRPSIPKRLIKRPKIYWRDTGLLHAQLNITDEQALPVATVGRRELGGVCHRADHRGAEFRWAAVRGILLPDERSARNRPRTRNGKRTLGTRSQTDSITRAARHEAVPGTLSGHLFRSTNERNRPRLAGRWRCARGALPKLVRALRRRRSGRGPGHRWPEPGSGRRP